MKNDDRKTRAQLIEELQDLRRRMAALEERADQRASAIQDAPLFEEVRFQAEELAVLNEFARLFEQTQVRTERLAVLNRIARGLGAALHVDEMLDVVHQEVSTLFSPDACFMALYDEERDELDLRILQDRGVAYPLTRRPLGTGLTAHVVRNRMVLLVRDYQQEQDDLPLPQLFGGMEMGASWLGVPMQTGGRVNGVICLQSYTANAYGEEDLQLLSTIAGEVAVAVERAHLFDEARRRADRLSLLNRIARTVGATLHLDELLEKVCQEIMSVFPAESFFVALYDEQTEELDLRVRVDCGVIEPPLRLPLGGLTSFVVTQKRPLLIRNLQQELDQVPAPVLVGEGELATSWLGVPMVAGRQVIGVINVQSHMPFVFDEEDQLLLSTIADQVSMAVEGARLYEQAQQEILERKRAEVALRGSEERYRMLVTQAPIGVITCDRAGEITQANSALLQILDLPGGLNAEGHRFLDMAAIVQSGIAAAFRRCMEDVVEISSDYQYPSPGGKERVVRMRLIPLRDEAGAANGVLGTLEDVTEQRRLQEQLVQSAKLASIGELAAGVAHEINNPINGIINYAQLLLNRSEAGSRQAHFLEGILREGDRVASIVRDLLTFARTEKEAHSPESIPDILGATLTLSGQLLKKDNIVVDIDAPAGLPQVTCRGQRIQQVFLNLISNARDALNARYPDEDPQKRLAIRIEQVQKNGRSYVRISFHDRGVGIAASHLSRVFTPFFTTKRPGDGTGLGLSVSYGIVQDHQGDIQVESVQGEYTIFRVDLPVVPER